MNDMGDRIYRVMWKPRPSWMKLSASLLVTLIVHFYWQLFFVVVGPMRDNFNKNMDKWYV